LRLRTTIIRVTLAKIEPRHELFRGEERLAVGQVTLAVLDRQGQVCRVPDWMGVGHQEPLPSR
jgi:acyl-CoA thioesterase FadM